MTAATGEPTGGISPRDSGGGAEAEASQLRFICSAVCAKPTPSCWPRRMSVDGIAIFWRTSSTVGGGPGDGADGGWIAACPVASVPTTSSAERSAPRTAFWRKPDFMREAYASSGRGTRRPSEHPDGARRVVPFGERRRREDRLLRAGPDHHVPVP